MTCNSKIALFYNSPTLGGAERSVTYQAQQFLATHPTTSITCYLPLVKDNNHQELKTFINQIIPQANITYLLYPYELFSVSRSAKIHGPLAIIIGLIELLLLFRKEQLSRYTIWWCNGNKIATVLYFWAFLTHYSGKFIWHFRDYPSKQFPFHIIWKLINSCLLKNFITISNSNSVKKEVKRVLFNPAIDHRMFYNPVGENLPPRSINNIETIGVVSMLAPWKGIHQIIIWASIYETQLKSLGIREINIYGANIYATAGAHSSYAQQLNELLHRFPSTLIKFCGKQSPLTIFKTIDLLIHPTLTPEPFGRIITEAFSCMIPVISTALGGAQELLIDNYSGLNYTPSDYATLFNQVKELTTDRQLRLKITQNAQLHLKTIEQQSKTIDF